MIVNLNLGQMLAMTELVHQRIWLKESADARNQGRALMGMPPVVAYTSDGTTFRFYQSGKVTLNGKAVETVGFNTRFVPVIPVWYGEDMDNIWDGMYITDVYNPQSEAGIFGNVSAVAEVYRIISGGW